MASRVNIVVPTHGRRAGLEACIAAIERPVGIDVEVIVVENGSSGGAEIASSYGATYLHIDEANAARARNSGALHRDADAVAFLDDDVVPHPGWLEKITAPILEDRADAVAGWVEVVTDGDVDRRFLAFYVHSETALDPHRPFLGASIWR